MSLDINKMEFKQTDEIIDLYGGINVMYVNDILYFKADDILHNELDWSTFQSMSDYDRLISKYPVITHKNGWNLYHKSFLLLALAVRSTKYSGMTTNEIIDTYLTLTS